MKQIDLVLDMVKEAEGGKLHRNKSELDITTGYGIYKHVYPNEQIFKYIDEVAKSLNITKDSKDWNQDDLEEIQYNMDKEKEFEYTKEFYSSYFKIDLSILPNNLALAYCSIYVNSNKIANIALQKSVNFLISNYCKNFKKLSTDGVLGKESKKTIEEVFKFVKLQSDQMDDVWFLSFINFCQAEYVNIATDGGKEDKHLQYLKGWINRCINLLQYSNK